MSAAETGIFGSLAASVRKEAASSAGTVRLTGSDSPPCGGTRSAMVQCADRKSTRLNSSHLGISYAVFCLKKKKQDDDKHKGTLRKIQERVRSWELQPPPDTTDPYANSTNSFRLHIPIPHEAEGLNYHKYH